MSYTHDVLMEIFAERVRQEEKWGEQNWFVGGDQVFSILANRAKARCTEAAQEGTLTWRHILDEEVWEVFENEDSDPESQRAELVQVAAVAVAAIEAIDRRSRLAIQPKTLRAVPWSAAKARRSAKAQDASGDGAGAQEGAERASAPPQDEAPDVA